MGGVLDSKRTLVSFALGPALLLVDWLEDGVVAKVGLGLVLVLVVGRDLLLVERLARSIPME